MELMGQGITAGERSLMWGRESWGKDFKYFVNQNRRYQYTKVKCASLFCQVPFEISEPEEHLEFYIPLDSAFIHFSHIQNIQILL